MIDLTETDSKELLHSESSQNVCNIEITSSQHSRPIKHKKKLTKFTRNGNNFQNADSMSADNVLITVNNTTEIKEAKQKTNEYTPKNNCNIEIKTVPNVPRVNLTKLHTSVEKLILRNVNNINEDKYAVEQIQISDSEDETENDNVGKWILIHVTIE